MRVYVCVCVCLSICLREREPEIETELRRERVTEAQTWRNVEKYEKCSSKMSFSPC